jgi:hypothetical protein
VWEEGPEVDKSLDAPVKIAEGEQMQELITEIGSGNAPESAAARGRLIAKVVRWVVRYGVTPPIVRQP